MAIALIVGGVFTVWTMGGGGGGGGGATGDSPLHAAASSGAATSSTEERRLGDPRRLSHFPKFTCLDYYRWIRTVNHWLLSVNLSSLMPRNSSPLAGIAIGFVLLPFCGFGATQFVTCRSVNS